MPLGKYKDFTSCHAAKMREGLSDPAASRYCGRIYQQVEGASSSSSRSSSLESAAAPFANKKMSEQMMRKEEGDQNQGTITLTREEATALAEAVFNGDLETAKKILTSVMDIEAEAAPPGTAPS